MSRIRALYCDVDGTLTGPGGSLFASAEGPSARAAEALLRLARASVELVLVSGRTIEQLREAARIVGARSFIAELGAYVVERGTPDEVVPNLGAFRRSGTPFAAMARSGAGAFLMERYPRRLEPHAPWAFQDRAATMVFRGGVDDAEATRRLEAAGYTWLELRDNGRIPRRFDSLDVEDVHAYHLVPRGVSKASGVLLHRERRGLERRETAAVGDSAADLEMAAETGAMALVGDDAPEGVVTATTFADAVERLLR